MADVLVLDLDRTVASFPATSRLYWRVCVAPGGLEYKAWGFVMLVLMHGLWFIPAAVRLQRRIVMSLFARADAATLDAAIAQLVDEVVRDFRGGLGARLREELRDAEAVHLLTHAPRPLAEGVCRALGFDGQDSVEVADYLGGASGDVFDKRDVLERLRERYPSAMIWYFADDLVDLSILRAADCGTLVNGTAFSRWVCARFFPEVRQW